MGRKKKKPENQPHSKKNTLNSSYDTANPPECCIMTSVLNVSPTAKKTLKFSVSKELRH